MELPDLTLLCGLWYNYYAVYGTDLRFKMLFRHTNTREKKTTNLETGETCRTIEEIVEQREQVPVRTPFMLVTQKDTDREQWLKLSPPAFKIFVCLARLIGTHGDNHVNYSGLELVKMHQGYPGMSKCTFEKALKELKAIGFIRKHPQRGYIISEHEIYKRATTRRK